MASPHELLDYRKPEVLWTFNTFAPVHSTPAISVGCKAVFFGCDNNYFYAVDPRNGSLIWDFKTGASVGRSSPSLMGSSVLISSSDYKLYSLSCATGAVIWSFLSSGNLGNAAAVIGGDGSVYIGTDSTAAQYGQVISLNGISGIQNWVLQIEGNLSSPAIGADGS